MEDQVRDQEFSFEGEIRKKHDISALEYAMLTLGSQAQGYLDSLIKVKYQLYMKMEAAKQLEGAENETGQLE